MSVAELNAVIAALRCAPGPNLILESRIAAAIELGNSHLAPAFTGMIDKALLLVPENWFWRVGRTSLYRAWAGVYKSHPDHCDPGHTEFFFKREHHEALQTTPAMALCIVALEARLSIVEKRDR